MALPGDLGSSFLDMQERAIHVHRMKVTGRDTETRVKRPGASIHFLISRSSQGPKFASAFCPQTSCVFLIKLSFAVATLR